MRSDFHREEGDLLQHADRVRIRADRPLLIPAARRAQLSAQPLSGTPESRLVPLDVRRDIEHPFGEMPGHQ